MDTMTLYEVNATVQARDPGTGDDGWRTVYGIDRFYVRAESPWWAERKARNVLCAGIAIHGNGYRDAEPDTRLYIGAVPLAD